MTAQKINKAFVVSPLSPRVMVDPNSGCWLWTGAMAPNGYGRLRERVAPGSLRTRHFRMHRVAYEINRGAIPEGLFVLHKCDTRACVNPDHLFLGTHQDNMNDRGAKGRQVRGGRVNTSKLTEQQAREVFAAEGTDANIGKMFGISATAVKYIKSGRNWAHLGLIEQGVSHG